MGGGGRGEETATGLKEARREGDWKEEVSVCEEEWVRKEEERVREDGVMGGLTDFIESPSS